MNTREKAVREAAAALSIAIADARSAGLHVQWPHSPEGLNAIAISETKKATVTNIDGSPVKRDADGTIHGEPLNITDEERAKLPRLDPNASEDPSTFVVGTTGKRKS